MPYAIRARTGTRHVSPSFRDQNTQPNAVFVNRNRETLDVLYQILTSGDW